jgi:SAM-dependent methyltransferase
MDGLREALRTTFDTAAETYDAARPSYPPELFDDLVALSALRRGARLLEIGPGTGKATRALLDRGYSVVGVELGERLAEQARSELAGRPVEIHVASFEEWNGQPASFELVYAATAWHWVSQPIGYRRAHELLRPDGHLAFWSAEHAFPADVDPFLIEIQEVYEAIGEARPRPWPPPRPEEVSDAAADIEASGLFEDVRTRRYLWHQSYTAEEYLALLDTFSNHIAMEPAKRQRLDRRLDKEIRQRIGSRDDPGVRRHWLAILHVARRTPTTAIS